MTITPQDWAKIQAARVRRMGSRQRHRTKDLCRLGFADLMERVDIRGTVTLDCSTDEEDASR